MDLFVIRFDNHLTTHLSYTIEFRSITLKLYSHNDKQTQIRGKHNFCQLVAMVKYCVFVMLYDLKGIQGGNDHRTEWKRITENRTQPIRPNVLSKLCTSQTVDQVVGLGLLLSFSHRRSTNIAVYAHEPRRDYVCFHCTYGYVNINLCMPTTRWWWASVRRSASHIFSAFSRCETVAVFCCLMN